MPEAGSAPALGGDSEPGVPPASGWTRWTLSRLATRIQRVFGFDVCRETVRKVLHRIGLSWKKAKKLLGRADPDKRREFVADIRALLDEVRDDEDVVLAYIDEAHVHQDADLGYGWSTRGERLWVASSSPGLSAKVSFYGVYLYSESRVHIWPYERANGEHTIDVLRRLRKEFPERRLLVVWDGAPYHRAGCVLNLAKALDIRIVRLPAYSPDFMPVEALWHWLRESVTYNHCHWTAEDLKTRVEAFVEKINASPCELADRLWVKDELDLEEEAMRFKRAGTPSSTAKNSGVALPQALAA
jgi:transposase